MTDYLVLYEPSLLRAVAADLPTANAADSAVGGACRRSADLTPDIVGGAKNGAAIVTLCTVLHTCRLQTHLAIGKVAAAK